MSSMYDDVVKFHQNVLVVEPELAPTLQTPEWCIERFRFLKEEADEFIAAAMVGDIVKAADGLLDTVYVALGTLYMMGIPVEKCWDAVQTANMGKIRGQTKRGNKIDAAKPAGWVGPEAGIAAAIGKTIDP